MSALSWSLSSAVGQLSYSLTPLNKSSSGATITSQKKEAQFEILLLEELLSLVMAFYIVVKKTLWVIDFYLLILFMSHTLQLAKGRKY